MDLDKTVMADQKDNEKQQIFSKTLKVVNKPQRPPTPKEYKNKKLSFIKPKTKLQKSVDFSRGPALNNVLPEIDNSMYRSMDQ